MDHLDPSVAKCRDRVRLYQSFRARAKAAPCANTPDRVLQAIPPRFQQAPARHGPDVHAPSIPRQWAWPQLWAGVMPHPQEPCLRGLPSVPYSAPLRSSQPTWMVEPAMLIALTPWPTTTAELPYLAGAPPCLDSQRGPTLVYSRRVPVPFSWKRWHSAAGSGRTALMLPPTATATERHCQGTQRPTACPTAPALVR